MNAWRNFLDSLDSDGGHIAILLGLIGFFAVGAYFGMSKAEEILMGAFGAVMMKMQKAGSNKEQRDAPPPVPAVIVPDAPPAPEVIQRIE